MPNPRASQLWIILLLVLAPFLAIGGEFVVWNVGQGSWASEIGEQICVHYDIGGERYPHSSLLDSCKKKINIIALSHLDWDHVSFLMRSLRIYQEICFVSIADDPRAPQFFKRFPQLKICEPELGRSLLEVSLDNPSSREPNATSDVYFSKNYSILLPGDLPKAFEKLIPESSLRKTQVLVLAHHGSSTSTSKKMLLKMANLKMAIASARERKYHHPHPKTKALLRALRIPLLRTEDWGHIHILNKNK